MSKKGDDLYGVTNQDDSGLYCAGERYVGFVDEFRADKAGGVGLILVERPFPNLGEEFCAKRHQNRLAHLGQDVVAHHG